MRKEDIIRFSHHLGPVIHLLIRLNLFDIVKKLLDLDVLGLADRYIAFILPHYALDDLDAKVYLFRGE